MHPTTLLPLLLPALTSAADTQKPIGERARGWLSAAGEYLPTAFPTVPGLTAVPLSPKPTSKSPISAAASKIAALKVQPLTMSNYASVLTPDPSTRGPTDWMVFVTGGNKTCGGHCHNLEVSWNETASILAADPTAPKLGIINCDEQRVLCTTWTAKPPTIWHFTRPTPGETWSKTDVHVSYLNFTTTTAGDMVALHTGNKYKDGYLYEGIFHLFDGPLAKYGLLDAVGYVIFAFGLVPSWAFMLIISMVSRNIMWVMLSPFFAIEFLGTDLFAVLDVPHPIPRDRHKHPRLELEQEMDRRVERRLQKQSR